MIVWTPVDKGDIVDQYAEGTPNDKVVCGIRLSTPKYNKVEVF